MSSIERRQDAWVNLTTGIGGAKDKSSGYQFASSGIDQAWLALEQLYEEDHVAAKIVDALPDAVFANGIMVEIADPAQKEAVLDKLDQLGAEDSIDQAMRWERLHGGAAIFMGVEDGKRFDEPLVEENVRQVLYLHVFDRWELYPARFYEDPKSPKFGQPSHYRVSPSDSASVGRYYVIVHETRLIKFGGLLTTKRKLIENQYWGQSVLVRAYNAIKQYGGSLAAVLAAMSDASQGVYKIRNLMQIIEGGNEALLQTRFRAIDQLRSVINSVLLDADGEDYQRIVTPLTELANLVDRFQVNVSSAADMPVTEVFGISAAGLNATGENDTRSWYKKVSKAQRKKAKPSFERILRVVFRSKAGPTKGIEPASWSVKFPPVWSPTALEQVQIKKTKVETAVLAKDLGVVTEHQIARGLFSGSEWDGDIVLTADEIDALRIVRQLADMPTQPVGAMPTSIVPDDGETQLTQDDEGEELAALNPRQLAERMTELGVKRCEHGKSNRCQLCGVERHRELLDADGDGNGTWSTSWRAIGARAPAPAESDPDAADDADE
jgi:phage-related protein (TIGR01555 family)